MLHSASLSILCVCVCVYVCMFEQILIWLSAATPVWVAVVNRSSEHVPGIFHVPSILLEARLYISKNLFNSFIFQNV